MSDRNGLTSLLVDRKISTKVALGFACVLVILGTVSCMAYFAFISSAERVLLYSQRVAVVDIARDIDRGFISLRRFVREYAFTGVAANIDEAKKEETSLRGLIQRGLTEIKNPERHRRLENFSSVFEEYLKNFVRVIAWTQEQGKSIQSGLDPLGDAQRQHFDALITGLTAANDTVATAVANEGLKHFMLARLGVNKLLARQDAATGAAVAKSFGDLDMNLRGLDAATKGTAMREAFEQLRMGVA